MHSQTPRARPSPECFYFVISQAPGEGGGKRQPERHLAHSHAVKRGLEERKKLQQSPRATFRTTTSSTRTRRLLSKGLPDEASTTPLCILSVSAPDPFQTLPIDMTRLQTLLSTYEARQAPEPVFSFADELAFQSFRAVFRTGAADAALLSALMLSLTFATTGGSLDRECLKYKGQTISGIRVNMESSNGATSEFTIGAILLLAGIEARLGTTSQAQLHMSAVRMLLDMCRAKGVHLTGGIKRATFWQDLNSSIIAGTSRIVDHTTFSELRWTRDPFSPTFYRLPVGFQKMAQLLGEDFVEVLEDLYALRCIRGTPWPNKGDPMMMININNHIASIQSRLAAMRLPCPLLESCRLTAYLCSVMLCCKVWCALVFPVSIVTQLLHSIQQAIQEPVWDEYYDLFVWIIHIGGAFAPMGQVRSGYVALLRSEGKDNSGRLPRSWPEVLESLRPFIWSKEAFMVPVKAFWEEAS